MSNKIRCSVDNVDWIKVEVEEKGNSIQLDVSIGESLGLLFLTPTDARKLRKQIKKALEAIEGVEKESGA